MSEAGDHPKRSGDRLRTIRHWLAWVVMTIAIAGGAVAFTNRDSGSDTSEPPGRRSPAPRAQPSSPHTSASDSNLVPAGLAECKQSEPDGPAFRLSFYDDFDEPTLNTTDWYAYDSVGNAEFGLRRPSALSTKGGRLVITAQMIDGVLVSGGMAHLAPQIYGRFEFRVRTDPDPSQATSGVVLTWPESGNWPVDGENDIYETEEYASRNPFQSFIHYGESNEQEVVTHDADGTEWHDMAMDWTRDRIAIYRDGELAGEVTNPEAIPEVPHQLTIQLDAWEQTMGDPVTMEVDSVRVYRWEEGGSC
jgi:hypothetical protein